MILFLILTVLITVLIFLLLLTEDTPYQIIFIRLLVLIPIILIVLCIPPVIHREIEIEEVDIVGVRLERQVASYGVDSYRVFFLDNGEYKNELINLALIKVFQTDGTPRMVKIYKKAYPVWWSARYTKRDICEVKLYIQQLDKVGSFWKR